MTSAGGLAEALLKSLQIAAVSTAIWLIIGNRLVGLRRPAYF